jgi:CheY-like chemotaxis protein
MRSFFWEFASRHRDWTPKSLPCVVGKTMVKTTKSTKPHILCVDGYRESHDVLTLILEQHGYRVTTAHSSEDAVRLAQGQQFDLYIMDSWPPEGAEYELCRLIRTFDANTPLLFYTLTDQDTGLKKAFAAGGQGHLRKPTYPKRLMQTIDELLNNAKSIDHTIG